MVFTSEHGSFPRITALVPFLPIRQFRRPYAHSYARRPLWRMVPHCPRAPDLTLLQLWATRLHTSDQPTSHLGYVHGERRSCHDSREIDLWSYKALKRYFQGGAAALYEEDEHARLERHRINERAAEVVMKGTCMVNVVTDMDEVDGRKMLGRDDATAVLQIYIEPSRATSLRAQHFVWVSSTE
ncbi:hypothetical protein DOTSEDRAFT_38252 [Dothistroma septosporum NZE10]|uniref:Uncharacterized protein n=1 Tax=Dothistroma septosporum (strain NZE10 / CBS 128990) TaxID=675120 RepID=N1PDV5_DOTSN|nr:hypothetical protein DOTSEDRAFT_38252 [Dothistroma septosporum NZE10]